MNGKVPKKFSAAAVLLLLFLLPLTAVGMETLYDMVLPMERTELEASGSLGSWLGGGSDAVQLGISTAGGLTADLGVYASLYTLSQTVDQLLEYSLDAEVSIGTSDILLSMPGPQAVFKQYGLDISGMSGFLSAAGDGNIEFSLSSGFDFELDARVGVGVGREFAIDDIIIVEIMMKHLGVVATEEKVRAVTELMRNRVVGLNVFTDNAAEPVKTYWQEIAAAMGIPDRAVDLIVLGNSQLYAYEIARYARMKSGTEGELFLKLSPEFSNTFSIGAALGVGGAMNGMLLDNAAYYRIAAAMEAGLNNAGNFSFIFGVNGLAKYFPEDYRWWAEGTFNAAVSIAGVTTFPVNLTGSIKYLIAPNFTTYAGVRISSTAANVISAAAGGVWRLW